jgi:preprotein translocase subunit YajC
LAAGRDIQGGHWADGSASRRLQARRQRTGSILEYLTSFFFLLAQDPKAAGDAGTPPGAGLISILLPIGAAIALYYFMILRPERRKQSGHRAQLETLKKNDRVVTIGGIYGVVMNVQRDADEVTLKIDETNNTRIRVTFSSIGRVVSDQPPGDKQS